MQLLFFTEARLYQGKNGAYYCNDPSFSYQMFKRYLWVFDKISIVARVLSNRHSKVDKTADVQVDGNRVEVLPLPYYIGPYQYLKKRKNILRTINGYLNFEPSVAVICRVPGVIAEGASRYMITKKRPFGLEVVGDPFDVFAPGACQHLLRPLFRSLFSKNQRKLVKEAAATMYVTRNYLQVRYPPGKDSYSTYASDVILPLEAFATQARTINCHAPYKVAAIGSLETMYKSPDIAIDAISILKKKGICVDLLWIGDGRCRSKMVDLAKREGVSDRIRFIGKVGSTEQVRRYLDASDIFLLPSRAEGLPRALIEAMARGCPCIATKIGGIPELIDEAALVSINNAEMVADKIEMFVSNPAFAKKQANRNLKVAKTYESGRLETKRVDFYKAVMSLTRV